MINQESIKRNLFKIKKIAVVKNDTWGTPVRDIAFGTPMDIKEITGVLIPHFDSYHKRFLFIWYIRFEL